jgi:hypothetical protein
MKTLKNLLLPLLLLLGCALASNSKQKHCSENLNALRLEVSNFNFNRLASFIEKNGIKSQVNDYIWPLGISNQYNVLVLQKRNGGLRIIGWYRHDNERKSYSYIVAENGIYIPKNLKKYEGDIGLMLENVLKQVSVPKTKKSS